MDHPTELAIRPDDEVYASELAEIRESISDTRTRISRRLEAIQEEVEEKLDWKAWVRENPWKATGVAFSLGLYLGIR